MMTQTTKTTMADIKGAEVEEGKFTEAAVDTGGTTAISHGEDGER